MGRRRRRRTRMDGHSRKPKPRRLYNLFKRKEKRFDSSNLNQLSGDSEDDGDDSLGGSLLNSLEMDPCISMNELRLFVGTWNVAGRSPVGSLAVDLDEWLNLKDNDDMYVLGFQEIVPLKPQNVIGVEDPTEATNWNMLIDRALNSINRCSWLTPTKTSDSADGYLNVRMPDFGRTSSFSVDSGITLGDQFKMPVDYGKRYRLMASQKMVGVFVSVWMKEELLTKYCVSNVKVCSVPCGIMGYLGNKGSVSVSMLIEGTSFCFIAVHLASGEKKGDEGRRNHQVAEIFRRTSFPRSSKDDDNPHPLTILGHDRIFWFGDLNYRLYLEDNLARYLIKKQDWKTLQTFDQLRRELDEAGVFQGWKEGNLEFAPTYKYLSPNCNHYSGGMPSRSGEKQRTPAWCDRILWYGKGVKQLSYFRSEIKFSDHRPVSAVFSIPVEVKKSNDHHHLGPSPESSNNNEKCKSSTLLSLINMDAD